MKKHMILLFVVLLLLLAFLFAFFIIKAPYQKDIVWGVNFSQSQTEALKLDWRKTYTSVMEELGARHIKLITQWDWVEGKRGEYFFSDIDWQVQEAEKRGVSLVFVIGMKTGRWPECHLPPWTASLSKQEQQEELLQYLRTMVLRYKGSKAITVWQVENEALFRFGVCPWYDKEFLKKEVALVKSLDATRQVIISDSGEQSLWFKAAAIGDRVGVTMYRRAWFHLTDGIGFYFNFPLTPVTYWYKSKLIEYFFKKEVICVELQAEPWNSRFFYNVPLQEQEKTMNLDQFRANIAYAKATGMKEFYLWGTEWWYWLKESHGRPEIWEEAKMLFQTRYGKK